MTIQELYDKCKTYGIENFEIEVKINDLQDNSEIYTPIGDIYFSLFDDNKVTIECSVQFKNEHLFCFLAPAAFMEIL